MSDIHRNLEPVDELGIMADAMLQTLAEIDDEKTVRAVVFLETEERCMTALTNWDSDIQAISAVIAHLVVLFKANGKELKIVPFIGHD